MTQREKGIILNAFKNAAKCYMEQEQILQEYMATNPQFPTTTQIYHRTRGEFLALRRLCYQLGIDGMDLIETLILEVK